MNMTVLIGLIGVALGGVLGYYKVYVPKLDEVRVIGHQAVQAQDDQRAREELATLLKHIERYRKHLAPEPEPSWLAREVVAIARKAGLELSVLNPSRGTAVFPVTPLSVELQFSASYHTLGMFLDDLEQSEYYLQVERLDIGGTGDADGQASVTLRISTFYVSTVLGTAATALN